MKKQLLLLSVILALSGHAYANQPNNCSSSFCGCHWQCTSASYCASGNNNTCTYDSVGSTESCYNWCLYSAGACPGQCANTCPHCPE